MKFFLPTLLVLFSFHNFCQDANCLFSFSKDNRYGYINSKGKIIVPAQYYSASDFSEGLAAVRLKGTYGYINLKGQLIIPFIYDKAEPFVHGIAKVYLDGKPYFINREGTKLFEHSYKCIEPYSDNNFAIVSTYADKQGVINKSGELIVDTVFKYINQFNNGIAVVIGFNKNRFNEEETGVIDTRGNWIVEYGRHDFIDRFVNGYAKVSKLDKDNKIQEGIINEKGQLLFVFPRDKIYQDYGNHFAQHLSPVTISEDGVLSKNYKGVVNNRGELLVSNPDWVEILCYSENRTFVQDHGKQWWLIDMKGEKVLNQSFSDILTHWGDQGALVGFQNGKAFVRTKKGWGYMDLSGEITLAPKKIRHKRFTSFESNVVIFDNGSDKSLSGFWHLENNRIVSERFNFINRFDFNKELVYVSFKDSIGYINHQGKVIWKGKPAILDRLNVDCMMYSVYYACSSPSKTNKKKERYIGMNPAIEITPDHNFVYDSIQLIIDTTQVESWFKSFKGYHLYVANTTNDTILTSTIDGKLYLTMQAQDQFGNWRSIEHFVQSDCGNSYRSEILLPNEYWKFLTPIYEGEFKTKLRAKLIHIKTSRSLKENLIVYSNEIDTYINPGQFWHQDRYTVDPIFYQESK